MEDSELIGRLEALGRYALHLTECLEEAGCIDGPAFSRRLRGPDRPVDQLEYMRIARERLGRMADMLDEARESRSRLRPK